jgi:hypothetical protein
MPTNDSEFRDVNPDQGWDVGWEGHELAQLRRFAAWPLSEKLRWLEEAQKLAEQLERAREQARRVQQS